MDTTRRSPGMDRLAHTLGAIGARLHQLESELPAPLGVTLKVGNSHRTLPELELRELGEYVLVAKREPDGQFSGELIHKTALKLELSVRAVPHRETAEQRTGAAPASVDA